jgi:hypothetical protein
MNDVLRARKEWAVKTLRANRPNDTEEAIQDYVAEAEAQEGDEYWLEFEDAAELLEDFGLWVENYYDVCKEADDGTD